MAQSDTRPAILHLEHGSIEPDRRVADLALHALLTYLHGVKSGVVEPLIERDVVGSLPLPIEPRLDDEGYWRLGVWLLEVRSGSLALTYRPAQAEPRFEYVAILRREGKMLKVDTLAMNTFRPRR